MREERDSRKHHKAEYKKKALYAIANANSLRYRAA